MAKLVISKEPVEFCQVPFEAPSVAHVASICLSITSTFSLLHVPSSTCFITTFNLLFFFLTFIPVLLWGKTPVGVRMENTEVEQGSQGLLQGSANPGSIDAQQHAHWHACISQLLETFKRDVLIHEAAQNLFTLN